MGKIWRKCYRSMYEGSMVGAGAVVFAVMGYVITHQDFDRGGGVWLVRLNPTLLGAMLGEKPEDVAVAIKFLCEPDGNSTSKLEEGRRLVPVAPGAMEYRVVNGQEYQDTREYEDRKDQNREAQARWRERQKGEVTDSTSKEAPVSKFIRPTLEQCKAAAVKAGMPEDQGERFWNYYESNGWRVGKNGMKSAMGAMANWKKNWEENNHGNRVAEKRVDRSIGTANEGIAHLYAGIGEVGGPQCGA